MSDLRQRAVAAMQTDTADGGPPADPTDPLRAFAAVGADVQLRAEQPPVEPDPDIPAELDVPVHVAWSRVMGDVQYVGKKMSDKLRYSFRGIDAVLNAVGPMLRRHGVMVLPIAIEPEFSIIKTGGGTSMNFCRATVTFAVLGPKGDRLPVDIVTVGEAFDSGDKASTKAQSVALRTAFINSLAIPTQQPDLDPEYGPQHEIAAPEPPSAQAYREEILDERTTRARMRQIRRELNATGGRMAAAVVQNETGDGETTLLSLCEMVGRRRWPL